MKLQRQVEGSYLLLSLGILSLCRATETSEPQVKIEQRVRADGKASASRNTPPVNISEQRKTQTTETEGESRK